MTVLVLAAIVAVPGCGLVWAIVRAWRTGNDGRRGGCIAAVIESVGWVLAPFYAFASGYCADDRWELPARLVLYALGLAGIFICGRAYDAVRNRGISALRAFLAVAAVALAWSIGLSLLAETLDPITSHVDCG